eukprot:CAMPEP_0197058308 /NCGR_PEP_ID=MMETSP1384-20130603/106236_1 /TAXON_ID=29189 /ORGANISM="Ammonia sp." /LENGTH=465 /DNA_ID=CAMNT_0042493013 /DNA_START=342 /DNA_END=1739 /DNA_ORIENTATION=+
MSELKLKSDGVFLPIRIHYEDEVDGNPSFKHTVIHTVMLYQYPSFNFWLVTRSLAKSTKSKDVKDWISKVLNGETELPAQLSIVYSPDDKGYHGQGDWLLAHRDVAIEPAWTHSTDKTHRMMRMMNVVFQSFGIDEVGIIDAARFACSASKRKKPSFEPSRSAGRAGLARVLRLWQGKKDLSIYQKGGYDFVESTKKDAKTWYAGLDHTFENTAKKIHGYTETLLAYTVYDFLTTLSLVHDDWHIERSNALTIITTAVPKTHTHKNYKVADALKHVYDSDCTKYYEVMEVVSNAEMTKLDRFVTALAGYTRVTHFVLLNHLQDKKLNNVFYGRLYERFGHPVPCSWGVMGCAKRGATEFEQVGFRCSIEDNVKRCPPKEFKKEGSLCWYHKVIKKCTSRFDVVQIKADMDAWYSGIMQAHRVDYMDALPSTNSVVPKYEEEIEELQQEVAALKKRRESILLDAQY